MTRHLTIEELLAVRDDEGTAAASEHSASCERCRHEMEQIDQRVARLRALPTRRSPRDRWPIVMEQVLAERRKRRVTRVGWGTLAIAAGLAMAVGVKSFDFGADTRPAARLASATPAPNVELAELVQQSQVLEAALKDYRPEGRVVSGRAASIIAELEDRIALIDGGISQLQAERGALEDLVDLWRDRVGLMDALVNVHVTRASYRGF